MSLRPAYATTETKKGKEGRMGAGALTPGVQRTLNATRDQLKNQSCLPKTKTQEVTRAISRNVI